MKTRKINDIKRKLTNLNNVNIDKRYIKDEYLFDKYLKKAYPEENDYWEWKELLEEDPELVKKIGQYKADNNIYYHGTNIIPLVIKSGGLKSQLKIKNDNAGTSESQQNQIFMSQSYSVANSFGVWNKKRKNYIPGVFAIPGANKFKKVQKNTSLEISTAENIPLSALYPANQKSYNEMKKYKEQMTRKLNRQLKETLKE